MSPGSRSIHPATLTRSASEWQPLLVAGPIAAAVLIGMATGERQLTTLAAVAALICSVVSPSVGLLLIAFLGPLKPPDVIPAPGFVFALVGASLMGCVYRLPIDRPRVKLFPPLVLILAFMVYVFVQQSPEMVTGYAGREPHRIGVQFIQLVDIAGAAIVAGYVLSQRRPFPVLTACLTAAIVASLMALMTNAGGIAASPFVGLLEQTDDGSRAVGPFGNPNYFGEFLAAAIATAAAWSLVTKQRAVRAALVVVAIVVGLALLLSLSRGAITALVVGLAVVAVLRNRPVGVVLVALGIFGAVILYPAFVDWRLGSASAEAFTSLRDSDAYRLDAILAGPQLFLTSPLFGIGFGQYSVLSAQYTPGHFPIGSHNWYMSVLAEQGLVGAMLWLCLLGSVAWQLNAKPRPARLVGLGVLATFAAGSLFTNQPSSFQTSVLPLIVVVATLVGDWPTAEPGQHPTAGLPGAGLPSRQPAI